MFVIFFYLFQGFYLREIHGNAIGEHDGKARFDLFVNGLFKGPSHMPIDFIEGTKFTLKTNKGIYWDDYTMTFEGECMETVFVSCFYETG